MIRISGFVLLSLAVAFAGCDSSAPAPATKSSGTTSAAAPPSTAKVASAAPSGSASAAPSASAPAASGPVEWTGKYTSSATDVTYDLAGKRFEGDPSDAGLGEGTLSLTVDDKGVVTGTGAGALGDVLVTGLFADGRMTLKFARKNATDDGFTGSATATATADKVEGEMHLSLARANVVRKAAFSLARKP